MEPSGMLEVVTPENDGDVIVTLDRLLMAFSAAYGTVGLPSAAMLWGSTYCEPVDVRSCRTDAPSCENAALNWAWVTKLLVSEDDNSTD